MQVTLCDLCPPRDMVQAFFHIQFYRIGMVDNHADRPIDVCQMHYDLIYQSIMGLANHREKSETR